MKRTGKLTIEIEHRETTLAVVMTGTPPGGAGYSKAGAEAGCQACGGLGSVPLAQALASYSGGQDALSCALASGELHLVRRDGALLLCEQSLKHFLATQTSDLKETAQ